MALTTRVDNYGITHDPSGYVPGRRPFVLRSCERYMSEYLEWTIVAPGVTNWTHDSTFNQTALKEAGALEGEGRNTVSQ